MISSNLARAGHASRITIYMKAAEGTRSGLRTDSVVMKDNLATVLESEIARVIGSLAGLPAVDTALRHTLGL